VTVLGTEEPMDARTRLETTEESEDEAMLWVAQRALGRGGCL
jgi:hypothetical protein